MAQIQTTIVKGANPLADLTVGESMTIRPANHVLSQLGSEQGAGPQSEAYSISCLRSISSGKSANQVFRGIRSEHGDIVVKVIRSTHKDLLDSKEHMAEIWKRENRFIKDLDHVS